MSHYEPESDAELILNHKFELSESFMEQFKHSKMARKGPDKFQWKTWTQTIQFLFKFEYQGLRELTKAQGLISKIPKLIAEISNSRAPVFELQLGGPDLNQIKQSKHKQV